VLEALLKSKGEDVISMLKILQVTTRYLHALCISTKVTFALSSLNWIIMLVTPDAYCGVIFTCIHTVICIWGCVTTDGIWIGNWIYWPLVHTTQNSSNYSTLTNLHTSQITTAFDKPFSSLLCLQQPSLRAASNSGDSSASCGHIITVQRISCKWTLFFTARLSAVT
jgi:hypothetical protein